MPAAALCLVCARVYLSHRNVCFRILGEARFTKLKKEAKIQFLRHFFSVFHFFRWVFRVSFCHIMPAKHGVIGSRYTHRPFRGVPLFVVGFQLIVLCFPPRNQFSMAGTQHKRDRQAARASMANGNFQKPQNSAASPNERENEAFANVK